MPTSTTLTGWRTSSISSLINNLTTAAGIARREATAVSTVHSTPPSRRSRLSTRTNRPGEEITRKRKLEGETSFCGISCTSPIARVRSRFGAVRVFLSFRSDTSMCCAGSSTSPTSPQSRTNGSRTLLRLYGTRAEPTADGPPTPDTPDVTGSGWRNRVRAAGTPYECTAC